MRPFPAKYLQDTMLVIAETYQTTRFETFGIGQGLLCGFGKYLLHDSLVLFQYELTLGL